jgi:hypothetical protein
LFLRARHRREADQRAASLPWQVEEGKGVSLKWEGSSRIFSVKKSLKSWGSDSSGRVSVSKYETLSSNPSTEKKKKKKKESLRTVCGMGTLGKGAERKGTRSL